MTQKSVQPPHIFAIADSAYQAMLGIGGASPKSQCCVIRSEDFFLWHFQKLLWIFECSEFMLAKQCQVLKIYKQLNNQAFLQLVRDCVPPFEKPKPVIPVENPINFFCSSKSYFIKKDLWRLIYATKAKGPWILNQQIKCCVAPVVVFFGNINFLDVKWCIIINDVETLNKLV